MRDDGVIKKRKLYETATAILHTHMKTHKRNNHLIRFYAKGMVAWWETYISLDQILCQGHGCLVENIYMNIHIHVSIICERHHKIIIRRNNDIYIFDILHMIQNPHLHIGPSHLTIKSLQVIINRWYLLHLAGGYSRSWNLDQCNCLFPS